MAVVHGWRVERTRSLRRESGRVSAGGVVRIYLHFVGHTRGARADTVSMIHSNEPEQSAAAKLSLAPNPLFLHENGNIGCRKHLNDLRVGDTGWRVLSTAEVAANRAEGATVECGWCIEEKESPNTCKTCCASFSPEALFRINADGECDGCAACKGCESNHDELNDQRFCGPCQQDCDQGYRDEGTGELNEKGQRFYADADRTMLHLEAENQDLKLLDCVVNCEHCGEYTNDNHTHCALCGQRRHEEEGLDCAGQPEGGDGGYALLYLGAEGCVSDEQDATLWESTLFDFINKGVEDFDGFMDLMQANVPKFDEWLESKLREGVEGKVQVSIPWLRRLVNTTEDIQDAWIADLEEGRKVES